MIPDDARCLTVWRCRTWGCGNVVTLLRTACNSFGPTNCPNCHAAPSDWEQLRHENINPGSYPFPSVESLVEIFKTDAPAAADNEPVTEPDAAETPEGEEGAPAVDAGVANPAEASAASDPSGAADPGGDA